MPFSGNGAGTSGDPYQITTLAQLWEMFDDLTAHYLLMNNIDASDTSTGAATQSWNQAYGWVPPAASAFTGTFNLGGFSITGLYANTDGSPREIGLFWEINNGEVRNGTIEWTWRGASTYRAKGGVCYQAQGANLLIDGVKVVLDMEGRALNNAGGIFNRTSGNIGTDTMYEFGVKNCEVDLINASNPGSTNPAFWGVFYYEIGHNVHMEDCTVYANIDMKGAAATPQNIAGIGYKVRSGTSSSFRHRTFLRRCVSNFVFDSDSNAYNIGAFFAQTDLDLYQIVLEDCWAVGYIKGANRLGGFSAESAALQTFRCWSDVELDANDTDDVRVGGIAAYQAQGESNAQFVQTLAYGTITLQTPNTNYSADVLNSSASITGLFYNSDRAGIVAGEPGNLTRGTPLTDVEMAVQGSFGASLDFTNGWQMGGKYGFPDLQNNLYDPTKEKYSKPESVAIANPTAQWNSVNSVLFSAELSGGGAIQNVYVDWGTQTGVYPNVIEDVDGFPYEAVLSGLSELDEVFWRFRVIDTDSSVYTSAEQSYTHYEVNQKSLEILVAEEMKDFNDLGNEVWNCHDVVHLNGFIYGVPRNPRGTLDGTTANIFKIDATDYTQVSYKRIEGAESEVADDLEEITECAGFLWVCCQIQDANSSYLLRIDPVTLDVVYITFDDASLGIPVLITNEPILSDETHLYINCKRYTLKILASTLTGTLPERGTQISTAEAVYDHYTDGSTNIVNNKVHTVIADGTHLYLGFTTGSGYNDGVNDGVFEFQKVDKSTMTFVSKTGIPKSTASGAQDDSFVFLGIETGVANVWGDGLGAVAVRKSDMVVFTTNILHPDDPGGGGLGSGSSLRFGNFLLDTRNQGKTLGVDGGFIFVIDISDPSSWLPSDPIGKHTLRALAVGAPSAQALTYNKASGIIANDHYELALDANENFHLVTWQSIGGQQPLQDEAQIYRFTIPNLSFTNPPIVQTNAGSASGDQVTLNAFVIDDNNSPVTAYGFEFGTQPGVYTNTLPVTVAGVSFSDTFTGILNETYYFRAYATNAIGTSYGQEQQVTTPVNNNLIVSNLLAAWLSPTSVRFSADVAGPNISDVRFEWGSETGVYPNTQSDPTSPFSITLTGLDEITTFYWRVVGVNASAQEFASPESIYTHYRRIQLPVDQINATDEILIGGGGNVSQIPHVHGSILLNIGGQDFVFGTSRMSGTFSDNTDVSPVLIKVPANDYSQATYLSILDENGYETGKANWISLARGFLWFFVQTAINDPSPPEGVLAYLARVNPSDLSYVLFDFQANKPAGYESTVANDAGITDDRYLYSGSNTVGISKIDLSLIDGSYANGQIVEMPSSAYVAFYDASTQGFHLHPNAPATWSASKKGTVHSYAIDSQYLYAQYTTGSPFDVNEQENTHELHKIRVSDMTAAGYARIPRCTDDMTSNVDYLFCGVEVSPAAHNPTDPAKVMGYGWGSIAIRKSDMSVRAIKQLSDEDVNTESTSMIVSYASTIFGNYLVELKTNKRLYVVDISDVDNWPVIDQFATPGTWDVSATDVGEYTVAIFEIRTVAGEPTTRTPNEIVIDSLDRFHVFGWPNLQQSLPSELFRVELPNLSFIAPPTTQTVTATLNETGVTFFGFIVSDNNRQVTEVGFEYGTQTGVYTNSVTGTISGASFEKTVAGLDGIIYFRAYAVNSEGTGYGEEGSITLVDLSNYKIEGTVIHNGVPIQGAEVWLINQNTKEILIQTTGADGVYSFAGKPPDDDWVVFPIYEFNGVKYSAYLKPFQRFQPTIP